MDRARRIAGLNPQVHNLVVNTLCGFEFDTIDGGATGSSKMKLAKLYPGVDKSTVEAMIPWP
jgi:hypothetical protein